MHAVTSFNARNSDELHVNLANRKDNETKGNSTPLISSPPSSPPWNVIHLARPSYFHAILAAIYVLIVPQLTWVVLLLTLVAPSPCRPVLLILHVYPFFFKDSNGACKRLRASSILSSFLPRRSFSPSISRRLLPILLLFIFILQIDTVQASDTDSQNNPSILDTAVASLFASTAALAMSTNTAKGEEEVEASTGRWTEQEHILFLKGLKAHGKKWKLVAAHVHTRTLLQTQTHAQGYFNKIMRERERREMTSGIRGDDDDPAIMGVENGGTQNAPVLRKSRREHAAGSWSFLVEHDAPEPAVEELWEPAARHRAREPAARRRAAGSRARLFLRTVPEWFANEENGFSREELKEELSKRNFTEVFGYLKDKHSFDYSKTTLWNYIKKDPDLSEIRENFAHGQVASWFADKEEGPFRLVALKEALSKMNVMEVYRYLKDKHGFLHSYNALLKYIKKVPDLSEIRNSRSIPVAPWFADEEEGPLRRITLKEELGKTGNVSQVHGYLRDNRGFPCGYNPFLRYINNDSELSEIYHSFFVSVVDSWLADKDEGPSRLFTLKMAMQNSNSVQEVKDAWDDLEDAPFLSFPALAQYLRNNLQHCSEDLKADCKRKRSKSTADGNWVSDRRGVAESHYKVQFEYHLASFPDTPKCKGLRVTSSERKLEVHGMDGNVIQTVPYWVSGVVLSQYRSIMIMTGMTSMGLHGSGGELDSEYTEDDEDYEVFQDSADAQDDSEETPDGTGIHEQKKKVTLSLVLNLGSKEDKRGLHATRFIALAEKNRLITNEVVEELIGNDIFSAARTSEDQKTLALDLISAGRGRKNNKTVMRRFKGNSKKDKAMTAILNLADELGLVITRALILRYKDGCGTIHSDGVYRSTNTFCKVIFKYGGGNFLMREGKDGDFCVVSLVTPPVKTQASELGRRPSLKPSSNPSVDDKKIEGGDWGFTAAGSAVGGVDLTSYSNSGITPSMSTMVQTPRQRGGGGMGDGYNEGYDEGDDEYVQRAPLAARGKKIFIECFSGGGAPASVDTDITKGMGGLGVSPTSASAAAAASSTATQRQRDISYKDMSPGGLSIPEEDEEDWALFAEIMALPESTKSISGKSPSHKKGRMFSPKTTEFMSQQVVSTAGPLGGEVVDADDDDPPLPIFVSGVSAVMPDFPDDASGKKLRSLYEYIVSVGFNGELVSGFTVDFTRSNSHNKKKKYHYFVGRDGKKHRSRLDVAKHLQIVVRDRLQIAVKQAWGMSEAKKNKW
ncbi:hypothetical protein TrCOL_g10297 [Triparma columacea]|uniref:Myb-like domain-containing protein n=1 Tax=Triparma columacea TaxID=722753 RepID=A0A9W7GHP8_9STRA|nr:hypothetical protein TrCOL_g10297 [Triparma columacea]